jgi:hypothetical protein
MEGFRSELMDSFLSEPGHIGKQKRKQQGEDMTPSSQGTSNLATQCGDQPAMPHSVNPLFCLKRWERQKGRDIRVLQ